MAAGGLLLQLTQDRADVLMHLAQPVAWADRFEDHQAALLQGMHIHIDGFNQLLLFAQAAHQAAAAPLSQNGGEQIGAA